jgi:hypothetical protein
MRAPRANPNPITVGRTVSGAATRSRPRGRTSPTGAVADPLQQAGGIARVFDFWLSLAGYRRVMAMPRVQEIAKNAKRSSVEQSGGPTRGGRIGEVKSIIRLASGTHDLVRLEISQALRQVKTSRSTSFGTVRSRANSLSPKLSGRAIEARAYSMGSASDWMPAFSRAVHATTGWPWPMRRCRARCSSA